MTIIQGLIIIALLILGTTLIIFGMIHRTESLNILECQNMYTNETLMEVCYERFGSEIDP